MDCFKRSFYQITKILNVSKTKPLKDIKNNE